VVHRHGHHDPVRGEGARRARLEHEPYLRLVIEWIGKGPRGCDAISVAPYGEQNGDPMRDLEIVFEVPPDVDPGAWGPAYYRNDYVGIEREAVWREGDGRRLVRSALRRSA
jgi:hypothetical protein